MRLNVSKYKLNYISIINIHLINISFDLYKSNDIYYFIVHNIIIVDIIL